MKKIILAIALIAVLTGAPAYAAQVAHVSVNGLVCDFCARSLEALFGKQDAVAGIKVDLDKKLVTVNFKEGQTIDDATVTKLITDSGYKVVGIHRMEQEVVAPAAEPVTPAAKSGHHE